ncbi:MAG: hypothetical protein H0W16_00150 [Actinobacteria bacterium]|nr:hypothetical protein [Actinomycetota bacterium]
MAGEGREGARADRHVRRGAAGTLDASDSPSPDPDAVRRSYQVHRARRRARVEHHRRSRRAGARFWIVLVLLVAACGLLAMTTWREIGRLFGL